MRGILSKISSTSSSNKSLIAGTFAVGSTADAINLFGFDVSSDAVIAQSLVIIKIISKRLTG